jgi:hypothetical protein
MGAGSRTDRRATGAPSRESRMRRSTRSARCRRLSLATLRSPSPSGPSGWARSSHAIRQTTTPAPASGGSPPSCSSDPAAANAPGLLILFQVVSIQPSERWTCEMRNSSIWMGDAADVSPNPERVRVQVQRLRIAHLRDARAVQVETLVARRGGLGARAARCLSRNMQIPRGSGGESPQ